MSQPVVYRPAIELVHEFHTTYRQIIRALPLWDVPERSLRINLIDEEVNEMMKKGYFKKNFIEVIDALADIVYVAAGAAHTHGLKLNLNIERPLFDFVQHDTDFSEGLQVSLAFMNLNVRFMFAEDTETQTKLLEEIILLSYQTAYRYGVDLDEVLDEVHRSNLSKLDENGQPIYSPEGKVLKGKDYFAPDIAKVLKAQRDRVWA